MRLHLSAVAAFAFAGVLPAFAADYPILRGTSSPSLPPAPMIQEDASPWEGFYLGGLAGFSSVNFNPRTGAADLARQIALRGTAVENEFQASRALQPSQFSGRGTTFGGFLGYNMQFGEAVLGFEADYMRMNQGDMRSDLSNRTYTTSTGYRETVNLDGTTMARLDDLVTLRLRTGYAMGNVMPYLTGGLAMGFGRVTNKATVTLSGVDADPTQAPDLPSFTINTPRRSETRKNAFMMGFSAGAGVEAMFGGLIVRGEYLFTRVAAQGGVVIDVNQARVGAGVKF
ncbi:MAG: porin family protein [Bosea sp.]|nr:porin family protein [Bosea sp. (in: a-proteobacteria)]